MRDMKRYPIRMAPIGKPRRKVREAPPLEIPTEWPTQAPVAPDRREKVPA